MSEKLAFNRIKRYMNIEKKNKVQLKSVNY